MKLRIRHADGTVEERALAEGSYRIGREDADIVLPHGSVSARHALLEVRAGGALLSDLGSRNGTLDPQARRITGPYALTPEQSVRLGMATLTLLRAPGQAGGTREMPLAALPGAPPLPLPRVDRGALPAGSTAPGTSRWLKIMAAAVLLLLGLTSLKTCTALVQALSQGR